MKITLLFPVVCEKGDFLFKLLFFVQIQKSMLYYFKSKVNFKYYFMETLLCTFRGAFLMPAGGDRP
jgi:hypothetical protein